MIHAFVLWSDDLEAEAALRAPCFTYGSQPEIYRLHVEIETLFPIAVFRQFALVKHDPESAKISVSVRSLKIANQRYDSLVPGLFVETLGVDMTAGSTKSPQETFLFLLCTKFVRIAGGAPLFEITIALEFIGALTTSGDARD